MTTLASQSCGKICNEDADFEITFLINSLTLTNEEKFSEDEKILTITWDGNVVRTIAKESLEEFKGHRKVIKIHCSPMQLNEKLKSSPILMSLMVVCEDLGTVKFPLTHCLCDAVLSSDFNSQTLKNDFKFVKDEIEHGTIDIDFKIERIKNQQSMIDAIKKSQEMAAKKKKLKSKDNSDSEDDNEDDTLCRVDFPCPNEIPEYCKKHLNIDEHSYRIINGHLMNVKDRRGFCGDICETAMKYCKELRKLPPKDVSCIDLQKLFGKRTENIPKIPSNVFDEISNWKFNNNLDDERCEVKKSFTEYAVDEKQMKKKKKKKRARKPSICETKSCSPSNGSNNDARNNFIKKMKQKAVGKYSYDFGNSYPFHRSTCSVPNVCEKIPCYMGWRHDKVQIDSQQSKCWQPGHVNKIVKILMKHFLKPYPYDTLPVRKSIWKKSLAKNEECDKSSKPTLQVVKRDGEIFIQMRPLKDNKQLATDCDPYLNCSPLKFIIKRHPEEIKQHKARKLMKSRGFQKKCNCCDIKYCRCISNIRKEMFKDEMKKISRELNMKSDLKYENVYDSSDSEIDFEFTSPIVSNKSYKCKPDVAHIGTQYELKHFLVTKKEKEKLLGRNEVAGCVDKFKKM